MSTILITNIVETADSNGVGNEAMNETVRE